jgi:hypothetical protein
MSTLSVRPGTPRHRDGRLRDALVGSLPRDHRRRVGSATRASTKVARDFSEGAERLRDLGASDRRRHEERAARRLPARRPNGGGRSSPATAQSAATSVN